MIAPVSPVSHRNASAYPRSHSSLRHGRHEPRHERRNVTAQASNRPAVERNWPRPALVDWDARTW